MSKQRQKQEIKTLLAAHQHLGPIIRLGPKQVSVASPEGLRAIYVAGLEKHPWYLEEFANFHEANLVSMLDHASHSAQKRVISGLYSKSYLFHSVDMGVLSAEIMFKRYLPLLDAAAMQGSPVNVFDLSQQAGLDVMTAYIFGLRRSTNFLQDAESRVQYLEPVPGDAQATKERREAVTLGMCKMTVKDLERSQGLPDEELVSRPIIFEKLYTHLRDKAKQHDRSAGKALKQSASEMQDALLATEETTAISMTYILYHVSRDSNLQNALHRELLNLSPLLAASSTTLPSPASISALPLLDNIVMETLRLHAASPGRQPRVVGKGGIMIHGHYISEGTTVSSNAYTLHRNADVFPNPESWQPNRWNYCDDTTEEVERVRMMKRYSWAFGSGGRMCIGSNLALQSMLLSIHLYLKVANSGVCDQSSNFRSR